MSAANFSESANHLHCNATVAILTSMNSAIRLQAVILVILSVHLCFLNGLLHDSSLGGELPNEAFNPLGGGVPDEGFNPVMTVVSETEDF